MSTVTAPEKPAVQPQREDLPRGRTYGMMAEFETPHGIYEAAMRVRDAGYRWWDCHTPFPVHGLDKAMGIKPTILPILVFFGGATGATIGFLLQWFTNATGFEIFGGLPGIWVPYLRQAAVERSGLSDRHVRTDDSPVIVRSVRAHAADERPPAAVSPAVQVAAFSPGHQRSFLPCYRST